MKESENELMKITSQLINQMKINIKDNINNSFIELTKNKKYISVEEIKIWKNNILMNINIELDKLNKNNPISKEEKTTEISNKKEYRIESKSKLNYFSSKDIQEENKEITGYFQNETYCHMNVNEKVENEKVALFLKDVAKLSRIAFNEGKKIFKIMKDKYILFKGNNISIDDEESKKEFSCWVKNLEKEKGFKEYETIINKINHFDNYENEKEQKILLKLFNDLSIMYFHCNISFPLIDISFNKEDNFNSDTMIDFINRGKNRKVNFVIFPSLISNGNFLQNGKSWVFTFSKNTFKFDNQIDAFLNNLLRQKNLTPKYLKDNLKIEVYYKNKNDKNYFTILTNINIPEKFDHKFIFYYINKNNDQFYKKKIKKKNFEMDKSCEIIKYEFIFESEIIVSSNIINEF